MEKVVLELTKEHAQVVQDACEVLMRMKLGQTAFPTEVMLGWPLFPMKIAPLKRYNFILLF